MKPPIHCPVCTSLSKNNKLILYQINLTKAVYLCEDKSCSYPKGHNWVEINRSWKEIPKDTEKLKTLNTDSSEYNDPNISDDFSIDSNEFLDKIFSEFENTCDTTGSATTNEFEEDFDMEQFEKDFFSEDLFNDTNDIMDKLDVNQETGPKILENQGDYKKEILTNTNNGNLKPKILNVVMLKPSQTKIEQAHPNACNNNKRIKVTVRKDPGCNISQEQIQKILKKLPSSNGETVVLNFKSSKLKKSM
nr:uncharacterized protein LOC111427262 [Onthophagus taurus]